MAEENSGEISADDWGAAMAEQSSQPAAQAHVFEQFGAGGAAAHNDLDMILDIPVQLTVELGRTKMLAVRRLKTLLSSAYLLVRALVPLRDQNQHQQASFLQVQSHLQ